MQANIVQSINPKLSLLDAAHQYRALGWPVIPLAGKLPAVVWKEFQCRYPTSDELQAWFTRPYVTGLGIVTGNVSQLVVVDCDSRQEAAFWQGEHGGSPLEVESGGGGVHFYYAMSPGTEIRNRQRLLGRAIDVRGEGGYIVAPPSLHPAGTRYAWRVFHAAARLPEFSAAWFEAADQEIRIAPTFASQQIRHAYRYILKITAAAGENGHNQTFRAACKLRDAGLSPEAALEVLTKWNETNAAPPWSAEELLHKISSAYAATR